jgi:hypothetical protein
VRPTLDNAQRVVDALAAFGAPLHGTSIDDLSGPEFVLQIGVAPVRIDILTSIDGDSSASTSVLSSGRFGAGPAVPVPRPSLT